MNFTKVFYKAKDSLKEHSPEILMGLGALSFVGTIFLACKATTKIEKILNEHEERLDNINGKLYLSATHEDDEYAYSERDAKKDKAKAYLTTAKDCALLYAPSFLCGVISLTSFFASYHIIHGRYVVMSTLATGLSDTLMRYRKRVVEELGEEMDDHFLNGTDRSKVSVTTMDENGKNHSEKLTIQTLKDNNGIPIYAKLFDEANPHWTKNPSTNLLFLNGQQAHANDVFKIRGVLLLNDVYTMLGIPQTEIGSQVGWFESHGDQIVDFGLKGTSERTLAFLRGFEPSILLNFNCVPRLEGDLAYA